MSTPRTAVVHLVRAANGIAPLEAFIASYDAHDSGLDHDLVLLLKGFDGDDAALAAARRCAGDRVSAEVRVGDEGFDVTAYLHAARELRHERLAFLNSYSTILAPDWLALLSAALDRPGTGLAGASGSWGSHRSFALFLLRLPSPYSRLLTDRSVIASAFAPAGSTAPAAPVGVARRVLQAARNIPREIRGYDSFPAPHLRTNAFVVDRELLLSIATGRLDTKDRTYRFEGGSDGLTAQVLRRGLDVLVVGRDGVARGPGEWPDADVFWQGDQGNLLVGDNQSRAYAGHGPQERRALSLFAWGDRARV